MQNLAQLFVVLLQWSKGVRRSRTMIVVATVTGGLAGLASTVLIADINAALTARGAATPAIVWIFVALCVLVPVSGFVSQVLLVRLTARAAHDLRIQLCHQVLSAPYRVLEALGVHRLLATISDDIPTVTTAIANVPLLFTQFAIVAGCLAYLWWLSWKLLLCVLVYMCVGIITHRWPLLRSLQYFRRMREEWDALFKAIRGLTEGMKELKLNRRRRSAFLAHEFKPPVDGIQEYGIRANTLALAAADWGQMQFFVFIGLVLFLTPRFIAVDQTVLTGYTLTILYMVSPLTIILNTLPTFSRAHVAAEKIKTLGLSLMDHPVEPVTAASGPNPQWRTLELTGVVHAYRNEGDLDAFSLGPLDLSLHPGELIFVVGGNGSGKTTLAKLLTGLYEPEAGEIRLDGKVVTRETIDDYRQYFSAVFSDFFLFESLLGLELPGLEITGKRYLEELQLSHKVHIKDQKLSTIELSQGQRKRLALLVTYLEDRPIYVFDEWAADQDPAFKQVFYYQILPELKARGKTVIVITHDDRYFSLADRVVKLERGRLEYDQARIPLHDAAVHSAAPV